MLNKTPKGAEVLQTRSINLPPKQRTLLLLANGTRSSDELLKQTVGISATQADLDALVSAGLLVDSTPSRTAPSPMPPQLNQPSPMAADGGELADLRQAAFQVRDQVANAPLAADSVIQPLTTMDANTRPMTDAERFEVAYRTATKLSSELGLRAFRLQLSLERASNLDEIRALRPKLLEALTKESGEGEALRRIKPLDRLIR